ncbi:hypothetical protein EQG63_10290 [Flavobacterium amnicola]|uniref:Prenyltransferase n=1 Tax=Flavobacterium amnicola TaxID=2506422 RepID=A0A4Q1K1U7_9FLAO|nr:hypothetical protein [Flavobacterium amnicola]RXR17904.1 hypothetical protein EQG63_10290 [Flavobacterium amnicola]
MLFLKRLIDLYIHGSIHVALAVYALVRMTFHFFHIGYDEPMTLFAFFGTIVGYNFVKYDELVRAKKLKMTTERKLIVALSLISFFAAGYYFFQLEWKTQLVTVLFLGLTILYTLPIFPKIGNARNWAGVKIYIVAFCWAGITLFLPIINADLPLSQDVWLKFCQRFLLVIILILIFEIIDLNNDHVSLQTVPQKLGIYKTKLLNLFLLIPFYCLEFFKSDFQIIQLWINLVLIVVLALFTIFASPKRSDYYTSFWVESVPFFWWLLVIFWK